MAAPLALITQNQPPYAKYDTLMIANITRKVPSTGLVGGNSLAFAASFSATDFPVSSR